MTLPMTWSDLGKMFDGPHATPKRQTTGPYFLNISSLKGGRLDLAASDHISLEQFAAWTRRVTPREGDLLFSYETRLGEAALMPPGIDACLGRRMALLRPDPEVVDSRYLLYYFLSPSFQKTLTKHTIHGATVPRILLSEMPTWPVDVHDVGEQRGIADVLGALDDKIAANATLAATSLELADVIFQRSADGLAFGSTTFEDVASIQGGGTPSTKVEKYWGGEVLWATPTDVTNLGAPYLERTARTLTRMGFAACSSALHPVGAIFMTSRATIGAFAIAQTPAAVNQGFIVVNAHDPMLQLWLFHEMRSRVPEFLSHANGATFLELSRGRFKKLPVRCPDDAASFQAEVDPIHRRARAAAVEAERLANTRDLLLPLLMSGKIKVKDAERVVEGVV